MRPLAGADRIKALLSALGREASEPAAAYLIGGVTAVLLGWRDSTVEVEAMIRRGLVDPATALRHPAEIEPQLFRFPAIDPAEFRRRAEDVLGRRRSAT